MLGVVRVIGDTRLYAVLETGHPALDNSIQKERYGSLCYGFVPVNASIERG